VYLRRTQLERLKQQAAEEINKAREEARDEAECDLENKRREYSLALSSMKTSTRDVLDNLAKQFRPLAYSCHCPQRVAVRGAQVCLSCLAKRICEKSRLVDSTQIFF
jgi:hypothetical protein